MVDMKTIPVGEKELETITSIYKSLQESNKNLWLMQGNILLASQNAHEASRESVKSETN